jgi:ATP-dependent helicase/nuclease subunit A
MTDATGGNRKKPDRAASEAAAGKTTGNTTAGARVQTTAAADDGLEPLLIRASAGTGKTYQLTGRLLRLLVLGAPVESMLATTFTRKAAGEILTRVLMVLAEAATDRSGHRVKALQDQTGVPGLTADDCVSLVHRLLRDIHRLRILTLDSLFSQLARTFGYELGLPPGWRLTDEVEDVWIRERAIDVMLGGLETEELSTLLAMLGKGDTKRSVRREMLGVVNDGYAEARACPAEAWQHLVVPKAPDPARLAEAADVLRATQMGHKSADRALVKIAELVDEGSWDEIAKQTPVATVNLAVQSGIRGGDEILYYRKPIPPDAVAALDSIAQACVTHVRSLLRLQTEATGRVIATYETQLMAMKRGMRAFAFDDIAHRLSEVFSVVSADRAGHRMDGGIEHVLLDEFQDTSPSQWSVLKPLALAAVSPKSAGAKSAGDESTREASAHDESTGGERDSKTSRQPHGSFFCVGDTKQAIYGWRGGVAGIFDAVADQVPGVVQREQNVSFRSSPVITSTVNQIFGNLLLHPELGGGDDPDQATHDRSAYEGFAIRQFATKFPEHSAAKTTLPGHVVLASGPAGGSRDKGDTNKDAAKNGDSKNGDSSKGDKQETSQTRSARHFGYVAQRIAELARQMPGRGIGVLTRTNRSVAWLIYLLRKAGVDVSQEGGNPLTDSPAVDLVLSALMMAEHPADRRWWFHVAKSPLAAWLATGPDDSTHQAAAQIRRLVEDEGIAGAVVEIADRVAPVCDAGDAMRLKQLVTLAQQYELNRQARIGDFVALVRAKRVEKPQPAQVRVMTVHQSKGLEFDVVVLPELAGTMTRQARQTIAMKEDATAAPKAMLRYTGTDFWHYLPREWQQAFGGHAAGLMTESLCLLYVAITRARHSLHMIVPPAERPDFKNKTAASLLYHALRCDADPTAGESIWYESGDPRWYEN